VIRLPLGRALLAALTTLALGACASKRPTTVPFAMGPEAAIERARADSLRYPYTKADIDFMQGMIHHHAQAITISRWAVPNGASPAVQRLTARIINAQSDEIRLMQTWLKDRNQDPMQVDSLGNVTMSASAHAGHDMSGMAGMEGMGGMADMSNMPGMLNAEQLKTLKAARGAQFDELFLYDMIQHHRGAVTMVKTLFASYGAAQDETVFKFAADVEVDQSTEIRRMLTMLLDMGAPPPY
jgi:uncharacterized protein (DUF305 family)